MTVPIDITDPKLVKAYAHPLRIRILTSLDERTASPSQLALEFGTPLANTSYHVRKLASLGLIQLVERTPRRGAIEHYYTAVVRPTITDEGWARLPAIVKRAHMGAALQTAIAHVVAAAESGGFDRDDIHYSRTSGRLDRKGWTKMADSMARFLKQAEQIVDESEARLRRDSDADFEEATALMMLFSGPSATTLPPRASEARAPDSVGLTESISVEHPA